MRRNVLYYFVSCVLIFNSCQTHDEKASATKQEVKQDAEKIKEANDFLIEVASGVYKEVELSRLAQERASLTKVREFAKNMISDYDKNLAELKELAARKNIDIKLSASKQLNEQLNTLSRLAGLAFDKEYIKMMVRDNEEDVALFRKEAETGKDIETKAFAAGKLQILVHHLDMAKTLHDSMIKS